LLRQRLIDQIRHSGPLPFEDFMRACLYDPDGGFFATGPLRSTKGGDFLTSPEVSPWFGRIIARYVVATAPGGDLVDAGAGSGSLLRSVLDAPEAPTGEVVAVEASPAARRALRGVEGVSRVVSDLAELPDQIEGTIVCNELLDNLPVALAVRAGDNWEERWVGSGPDGLELVAATARPEVAAWADRFGGMVPVGGMVEVQLEAQAWVTDAVARLVAGSLLAFDYGGTTEELEPRRTQGTLRTYRNHHLGPDPLLEPGETDVTVDVNFTAMADAATEADAVVEILRQDDFLEHWGLRDELTRMRHRERELARTGDAMERLVVRSEITDAETLLHPRGLGDFRVLVATPGTPTVPDDVIST
jgi:SAM-dependent MidA family methyltransferase